MDETKLINPPKPRKIEDDPEIEYIDVSYEDVKNDSWLGYEDGYIDET